MLEIVRTNLGIQVWLGIFAIAALVLAINAVMMKRAGLRLRPILWFAGFLAIIGVPQLGFHAYSGLATAQAQAPHRAALDAIAAAGPGATAVRAPDAATGAPGMSAHEQLARLFGPDVDPALVSDARTVFGDVFSQAAVARYAAFASGESVLLARFESSRATEDAWIAYLAATGLAQAARGDSERGFSAARPAGDRVYVLPMETMLGVWTGASDDAIRARMAAGGFAPHPRAPLGGTSPAAPLSSSDSAPAGAVTATVPLPLGLQMAALAGLLALTVLYFFRGAAWASRTPAATGTAIAAPELYARLMSVNDLDVPFRVEPGATANELVAVWRYADAKWVDLARAHGVRRVHRLVMRLDPDARDVRVTDFAAGHDWSAGAGGASFRWQRSMGITFYQYEHVRTFGVQVGDDGRFKPTLSHAYTFDLQEMKAPLIAAVTHAGWDWQPVLLDGPKWLRWLTAALLVASPALVHAAGGMQPQGPWRITKGAAAPWAKAAPDPLPNSELRDATVQFLPGRVEAPHPLGCANARYEFVVTPAAGLFLGVLPAPAETAARAAGVTELPAMTLHVACDGGVFDYHFAGHRTLVLGLDNVVWTLESNAAADSPEAVVLDLLVDHMTHDMVFTIASVARKRAFLSTVLDGAIAAYFARPVPADEPPPIDGDPFTDSQEYPSRFTLGDAKVDGARAVVPVVFSDGIRERPTKLDLVRADTGWKLDDMHYENGATLRELLK